MPRSLQFQFNDMQFSCDIHTVDRSKLYGSVSVETLDLEQKRCEIATLAIDGKTLIPNGGTALGYVNNQGDWISRKDLVAVDLDGEPLTEVDSSFKQVINLHKKISVNEFLNHSIRLLYRLKTESEIPAELMQSLQEGAIFRIEFSYRGGVDSDPAFILTDENQALWMMVSEENNVEYVALAQAAICEFNGQDDSDEAEEDESLDFGML